MDKALLDTDIFSEILKEVNRIAARHDVVLVTGNMSPYNRIQALAYSLKLEDWKI